MTFYVALLAVVCLGAMQLTGAQAPTLAWPPTLDTQNPVTRSLDGRSIERYVHGPRAEWGYPAGAAGQWGYPPAQETGAAQQNHNSFYLVAPSTPRPGAPLCVVLHSANRTAYDYLGYGSLGRKIDGNDDPATVMTASPDDFYALYLNSTNDEWWGWSQARYGPDYAPGVNTPPPAERRVLDTIEWVAERYQVDRNRIYLCGVSMGGCGTLGIGMANGQVFAAIRADVPAGTNYASYRRGGFGPGPAGDASPAERAAWLQRAAGVGLPDPPVIVDFSSQSDGWSQTQPALVQAAQAGRLPLVLCWGQFGHTTFASLIAKYPLGQVALAYPWLEIRNHEAYPVFTRATCDQRSPWLNAPVEYDESGQTNAYFRWQSAQDTPTRLVMRLWIAHPTVAGPPPAMPNEAVADVTLRRLQHLKVLPGKTYTWQLAQADKVLSSGSLKPDAVGLLTIPRVKLSTAPAELTVQVKE
ncbi:MAG TPA: hypothetical protein VGM19_09245 [Armatimonadota bacterium]|jgi:poly(3-hydroxybutyrate) depolymerase